jgi:hypothetical protein
VLMMPRRRLLLHQIEMHAGISNRERERERERELLQTVGDDG